MKWVHTQTSGWINVENAFQICPTKPEGKETWQVEIVFLESDKFYRVLWKDDFVSLEEAQEWVHNKMKGWKCG